MTHEHPTSDIEIDQKAWNLYTLQTLAENLLAAAGAPHTYPAIMTLLDFVQHQTPSPKPRD